MKKRPTFRNISILLADPDSCLSQAVVHCLNALGFANVTTVSSADEALEAVRNQVTSLIITEWDIKNSSGIELVRYLRRDPDSPNRAIPIIMLTGRGEMHDVRSARDVGITEFVVKPFSTQSLYNRLERIIDNPRTFVFSNGYVGPERRRRAEPPPGMADRRIIGPVAESTSYELLKRPPSDMPVILAPDHSLRHALAGGATFASLITPEILADAQRAIDQFAGESLAWIREDLALMEQLYAGLSKQYSAQAFEQLKATALLTKARAGTFGYVLASDVARLLYLFLNGDFASTISRHLLVIQKHLEVLKVVFANDIKERVGVGADLYGALEQLISSQK